MRPRLAAALALLLLASCGPDLNSVDNATQRAEAAAARAERSQIEAENSAILAQDVISRICAKPGLASGCSADGKCWPTAEVLRAEKVMEEACAAAYERTSNRTTP